MLKRIFVIICSNWPSIQYNTQVRRHEMASRPSCSLSNSMKFELNAQPLRRDDFWPFWIISFEFVKVPCWIRFSSWESFIRFYAWRYLISTILACFFTVGVWFPWKKSCWKGSREFRVPPRDAGAINPRVLKITVTHAVCPWRCWTLPLLRFERDRIQLVYEIILLNKILRNHLLSEHLQWIG